MGALAARSCQSVSVGEGFQELVCGRFRQEFFQVFHEPGIVRIADGDLLGVFPAEARMGAPEEDLSADHPHQGAVPQNIFGGLGVHAADDGNAAGHELPEVIPHRSQDPELRRGESGVLLGHGHAPGADISGHIDLPLGHGVAGAVAGVPWTTICAPALSQPTSSEAGPMTSMRVLGNPMEPDPLPGGPVIFT